jgi:ParB family chromosome partitioning protein
MTSLEAAANSSNSWPPWWLDDRPPAPRPPDRRSLAAGGEHPAQPRSASDATTDSRLRDIPLDQIRANPEQPRKRFDETALVALADSIRERGVLQPVIVKPVNDAYELLVAGERRWRAAQLAGESTIPALVATLLEDLRITGAVLAKRLGRSRADIVNTIRLFDLPDEAIELIDTGELGKGHGKALLAEPDHHRRRQLARRAAERRWSVRELEGEQQSDHARAASS